MNYCLFPFADVYARVSQIFGVNRAAYARFGLEGHNGVDWAINVGTPILAVADGDVTASYRDPGGFGLHVRIQHDGFSAIYAHFSRADVRSGEHVTAGQQLGLSGGAVGDPNAGNSTGPHLHLTIKPDEGGQTGYGGAVDPWPWLRAPGHVPGPAIATARVLHGLNVRKSPQAGTDLPVIDYMNPGQSCQLDQINGDWGRRIAGRVEWICLRIGSTPLVDLTMLTPEPEPQPVALSVWAHAVDTWARSMGYAGPKVEG